MNDRETSELVETLQRLLRHRDDPALTVDPDGWLAIEQVCSVASATLSRTIRVEQVRTVSQRLERVELSHTHIRVTMRPRLPTPDVLFHATTTRGLDRLQRTGTLNIGGRRRIYLSASESDAWRAAHRLDGPPRLLVVDALRARRSGVRIQQGRQPGLFASTPIPIRHILNLRAGYAEQWSAGGIPVRRDPDGIVRLALIRVTRRSGRTWEVAKGKLEPGEDAEYAAVREVQEEMGVQTPMRVLRHVGDVRYGFLTPAGHPRLKTIFLYLMEPTGELDAFEPSVREGIGDVAWFTADEAVEAVTHTSLQPLMWRARDQLVRYGLQPEDERAPSR